METYQIEKVLSRQRNAKSVFERNDAYSANVEQLKKRRANAKADLDMWRELLERVYQNATPNYNPFLNHGMSGAITPGRDLAAHNYDTTLPNAHKRLVEKMLMGMVPKGQQWVQFVPGDDFGVEDSETYRAALEATQDITEQFFNILDRSNFYTAISESFSDVLVSTGFLAINEGTKDNPLIFEAVPASHIMIEADARGGFSAVFRDWYNIYVEQITQIWPDASLPANKESYDKVNIWECSYVDYDAKANERYRYCVMTDSCEKLYEDAAPSWPWVIYRMSKMPGESRGRGPSMLASPSASTINEAIEDELIAAAFASNPMYMASSDSAYNTDTFTAKPGAIIPMQMQMGQWPLEKFPGGADISFSAMLVSDFRQQINDIMYAQPLGPVNSPDRTATESQIRYTENLESFTAMIPRLETEFFNAVIKRCFYLINKVVPETFEKVPPEIKDRLLSLDGQILDLKYQTPLMAARGQQKTNALLSFNQALAQLVGPQLAATVYDAPKLTQVVAQQQGVDLSVVKDETKLRELIEQAQEAMQQQGEEQQ